MLDIKKIIMITIKSAYIGINSFVYIKVNNIISNILKKGFAIFLMNSYTFIFFNHLINSMLIQYSIKSGTKKIDVFKGRIISSFFKNQIAILSIKKYIIIIIIKEKGITISNNFLYKTFIL
jgi:hypothetical protein